MRAAPVQLLHRTSRGPDSSRPPGWRLLVPAWLARRNDYCPRRDEFVDGWWWFSIGFGVEPIGHFIAGGRKRFVVGVALRITWGWIAFRPAT